MEVAAAPAATPKPASFLVSLVTPDPSMNYDFIAAVYAFLCFLSGLFWVLETYSVLEAIHGFWLVPAPCFVCLIYVLFLRARVSKTGGTKEKKN